MPKKTAAKKDAGEGEKELQKKYLQFQLLRQQLTALVEERSIVSERVSEMSMTISALKKLSDVSKGEEIWSTLGSGTFVRSDIKDTESVLVAVGAGVVIRETREKGTEILGSRLAEMQKIDQDLLAEITRIGTEAEQLERELQHAAENR